VHSSKLDAPSQSSFFCPWPLPKQGIDLMLLGTVLLLVMFGLLMVYSASFIFAQERYGNGFGLIQKQLILAVTGFLGLAFVSRVDYRFWFKAGYPLLGIAIVMLALVLIPGVGSRVGGAQRWVRIGAFGFQPGEFAKFALIFFVARQIYRKRDRLNKWIAGVFAPLLVPLPALVLLLAQPDFGTTVMIGIVILFLMFLGGVPKRYLALTLLLLGVVAAWLALGTPYRRMRLLGFLDPWQDPGGKGFQILQSLLGLYNGNLLGVGLGNGREKLFYLPEAHNDFIFAVIGEELGFAGVVAVVGAYTYLIYRGLKIAWRCHDQYSDSFGMLLGAGITLALGLQAYVNMAVVLGLLPTKGLTLPFVSYGGSALVIDLLAIGVLLSIGRGPHDARWEIRE
jgi:cell division protein FtsW